MRPSTLGTFLGTFTFGHIRQLDAAAFRLLIDVAGQARLLTGSGAVAYADVDDTPSGPTATPSRVPAAATPA